MSPNVYTPQYANKGKPERPAISKPLDSEQPSLLVVISGKPGLGKTRLAGTFPAGMVYDIDGGAHSANFTWVRQVPMDPGSVEAIRQDLVQLVNAPYDPQKRVYTYRGHEVGSIHIDSLDRLQQACMPFLMKENLRMEQADWGTLLNLLAPILDQMALARVPSVIIAHDKINQPVLGEWDSATRSKRVLAHGTIDTAVAGALRARIMAQATVAAYVRVDGEGRRVLHYKPTPPIVENRQTYLLLNCKDRHNFYKRASIVIDDPSGFPKPDWANATLEHWYAYLKEERLPQLDGAEAQDAEALDTIPEAE